MSRRAAAILLAIALIVALPSTASSATPSGKPAAEVAAQKKKPKKPKKHKRKKKGKKNKTPITLWYRIAIEGRATGTTTWPTVPAGRAPRPAGPRQAAAR